MANPGGSAGDAALLAGYLKDPTPGVAVVFEANRFDFEGDDNAQAGPRPQIFIPPSATSWNSPFRLP
ncbi:MAG: hypothetical protein WDO73_26775 [Ignavibacteriota bacterium]